jgi:hypothetical protein
VIGIFSSTREMTKEFMQAVTQAGLKTHEFVFILPWLQAEAKDSSPWIGSDGQMIQNVKEYFTGSIIVSPIGQLATIPTHYFPSPFHDFRLMMSTGLTTAFWLHSRNALNPTGFPWMT